MRIGRKHFEEEYKERKTKGGNKKVRKKDYKKNIKLEPRKIGI